MRNTLCLLIISSQAALTSFRPVNVANKGGIYTIGNLLATVILSTVSMIVGPIASIVFSLDSLLIPSQVSWEFLLALFNCKYYIVYIEHLDYYEMIMTGNITHTIVVS